MKQKVYRPGWWEPSRLEYTQDLATILAELLPESQSVGSISTLPIGWPSHVDDDDLADAKATSGKNLRELAVWLKQLESKTGRRIVIAIEPEPGCILDTTEKVIEFFGKELPDADHRRYLSVCHDICHSAVMMEPQAEVIDRLTTAGIGIGKVQVSSAVVADWQAMAVGRRREAIEQLTHFAEDRYLHQTGRLSAGGKFVLNEDLPSLLGKVATRRGSGVGDQQWVVSFRTCPSSLNDSAT